MSLVGRLKGMVSPQVKSRWVYRLSRPEAGAFENLRGSRKAIVALAADYANVGDIAIAHAQSLFLRACLPDYEIVDFPCASTYSRLKALQRVCTPDDLLTIVGGGNMGDRYLSLEDSRRFLIEQFPDNRVISFPQTIDFSETTRGRRELAKSRRCYETHRALHLFAREATSYDLMRSLFPQTPVEMVPDIALSLAVPFGDRERSGVLVCLRDDLESALGPARRATLLAQIVERIPGVRPADTVRARAGRLSLDERAGELDAILGEFRTARAVVTDRLHGMILAVVCGAPCVVMPNSNHKVLGTYRTWLAGLRGLEFVADGAVGSVVAALARVCEASTLGTSELGVPAMFAPLRRALPGRPV